MKELMAIIRQNRMNETKAALAEVGIGSFHARKVLGRGKGNVDYRVLKGAEEGVDEAIAQLGQGPRLIPKRMLSIMVLDEQIPVALGAIMKVNSRGNAGDGKIFVLPILDTVRVRNGDRDVVALTEDI